jgi:proton-dependent oligopeptide transporter, POT family
MPSEKPRHPPGLAVLFLTEMWERFSFYLMIGIFYQYLTDSQTGGMGWDGAKAASVVGSYLGLVYFTPFIGGLIADRLLGCRKTIFIGGFFFIAGHTLLAVPTEPVLYLALACLIIGNGCFKPNISTLVGNLYPQDSPLRDNAYTIFYMGINVGAFVCNFIAAIVRNLYGWHWAFATAGFGMALGVIIFFLGQKYIRHADVDPKQTEADQPRESLYPLFVYCLMPAFFAGGVGWMLGSYNAWFANHFGKATTAFLFACVPACVFFINIWRKLKDPIHRSRVAALLTIYGVVIVFWMVFQQNATALTAWAVTNTDRTPSALVKPVIDMTPEFAESAPPEYFKNAAPNTPRPDRSSYRIISDAEYEKLEKKQPEDGVVYPVTQKMFDDVYAATTDATPLLPPKKQLKLVNAELFQSINPGCIILFAPLMVAFWHFLILRRREPTTAAKIGAGLFLTGLSAVVMVVAVQVAGSPEGKVSAWWLFGTYAVITVGELCLSPMGLSLANKLSPPHLRAFMMGGWFLSTSIGNKMSGVFGEVYHRWDHTVFFLVNTGAAVVASAAIFALLPWLRRQMAESTSPAHESTSA